MPTPTRSPTCSPRRNASADRPQRLKDSTACIALSSTPAPLCRAFSVTSCCSWPLARKPGFTRCLHRHIGWSDVCPIRTHARDFSCGHLTSKVKRDLAAQEDTPSYRAAHVSPCVMSGFLSPFIQTHAMVEGTSTMHCGNLKNGYRHIANDDPSTNHQSHIRDWQAIDGRYNWRDNADHSIEVALQHPMTVCYAESNGTFVIGYLLF